MPMIVCASRIEENKECKIEKSSVDGAELLQWLCGTSGGQASVCYAYLRIVLAVRSNSVPISFRIRV